MEDMAAELKVWNAQIDLFTAKAARTVHNMKTDELEVLQVQRLRANEKMQELRASSDHAWESVKESAENVWHDLRAKLTDTAAKFK